MRRTPPPSPFPLPAQRELRSDDEPESTFLRRPMRTHDPRERAFVGDGERLVTERVSALHQLFRMRGAAQEGKVGAAVQLGVGGGCHANMPCTNQRPVPLRSLKTQNLAPAALRATK